MKIIQSKPATEDIMKPHGGTVPTGAPANAINKMWGSHGEFKKVFVTSVVGNFGSG